MVDARPVMLPRAVLLLPLCGLAVVHGVSQNVTDYCKQSQARSPQRANVILALRGESFRNGAGQATIHTCCPSSYARQREVFASHKAFLGELSARGFGTTHLLATTYACSRGQNYTEDLRRWYAPWLKSERDWKVLPHSMKSYSQQKREAMDKLLHMPSKHLADLQADRPGLMTQSKVIDELLSRVRPVVEATPPKLLIMLRFDTAIHVKDWALFDECLGTGPLGDFASHDILDLVPGAYAPCFSAWDDVHDNLGAGTMVKEMRRTFSLPTERRDCINNVVTRKLTGMCLEDDSFPDRAWYNRGHTR